MEIKYNIEKSQRKALAQKIADIIGADVRYAGVPSCAYEIDIFTLSKDAVLSFTDRSDTEIVEKVLDGLADAGYTSETVTPPEGTDAADAEPEPNSGFPLNASISFPLADHTVQSLTNLICMIHSRGALLSKATSGVFAADKSLVDEISKHEFRSIHEMIAFIREWGETNPPLTGISFGSDKLTFDGFGEAQDADHVQTFMKLAGAMNRMALTQKRVQAKDVDDSNEKYSLRVWLIRLGLNGADCKADRKRLMENLSGHSAFRNDAERERWEAKQKAKREAAKAEQNEEDNDDAVSE